MASLNLVVLMGRLTDHPELKQTANGTSVTSFNLAVDRKYKGDGQEKQTDFISIVAWRSTAEFICRNFVKGQSVIIQGEIQTRSWNDGQGQKRYATEVVASEARFGETKKNSESTSTSQNANASQSENSGTYGYNPYCSVPNCENSNKDDDLPF